MALHGDDSEAIAVFRDNPRLLEDGVQVAKEPWPAVTFQYQRTRSYATREKGNYFQRIRIIVSYDSPPLPRCPPGPREAAAFSQLIN